LRAGRCLVGHGMCPYRSRCTSAAAWPYRSSLEPVTLPTGRHSQEDKEEGREGISLFSLSLVPAVPALSPPCPRSPPAPSNPPKPSIHAGFRPIVGRCPRCPRRFSCFRPGFCWGRLIGTSAAAGQPPAWPPCSRPPMHCPWCWPTNRKREDGSPAPPPRGDREGTAPMDGSNGHPGRSRGAWPMLSRVSAAQQLLCVRLHLGIAPAFSAQFTRRPTACGPLVQAGA